MFNPTNIQDVIQHLEQACEVHQAFRELLQDSEKWILQMSFKLMNYNNQLKVTSLELTQQEIQTAEVCLEIINTLSLLL